MLFQATCSKWNKKLVLQLSAPTLDDARSTLHKQGYSIIEIKEVIAENHSGSEKFFYFDAMVSGVMQTGKIQSDDIFKAYRKLIEDLKYDIVSIYTYPDMTDDQKRMITAKVKDGYRLYLESIGETREEKSQENLTTDEIEMQDFSPQLIKELERYSKMVDETIEKVQNLIIKHHNTITPEQKSVLDRIELELAQIRWARNIGKVQSTLESVLKQIGAIELDLIKRGMIAEKQKFLAETNELLKGVWSGDRIRTEEEKQRDIEYKIGKFFGKIFSSEKKSGTPTKPQGIDKWSFIYFKNKRELDIYKKSLTKNNIALLKAIFSFQFSKVKRHLLKRRLLSQNIHIIDNRINNRNISYTRIVHWFGYHIEVFFLFIRGLSTLLTTILFLYTFFLIIMITLDNIGVLRVVFVGKSLLFLTIFSLLTLGMNYIRGWKTALVVITLFIWIFGFLSINF